MNTLLITGINGFLGSHLAKQFKTDYKIVGLEVSSQNLFRLTGENFAVYEANETDIKKLFEENNIDIIIHTATLYGHSETPKSILFENNVLAPIKLLEKAISHKVKAFINTDSFFNDPNSKYNYLSDYTLSKKQLIEWLQAFQTQIKIINMKIYHMYGSNDAPTKFVTWVMSQLKQNVEEIKLTTGEQMRDFIYIDDVVSAYQMVCENLDKINSNYQLYHVGTGNPVTLRFFIETARQVNQSTSNLLFGVLPYREGEIMYSKADNSSLMALGWNPKYTIDEGLKQII